MSDNKGALLAQQRYEVILTRARRYGAVRVSELVRTLHVSEVTIRRDIERLVGQGLLARVHGGATLAGRPGPDHPTRRPAELVIGMVVPSVTYYYPAVIRSAAAAAADSGARLVLHGSCYDAAEDRRQIQRLVTSGIHGLLVTPTLSGPDASAMVEWLRSLEIPLVLVERGVGAHDDLSDFDCVVSDHALGVAKAVRHLAGLGHEQIALVVESGSPPGPAVRDGYSRAMQRAGLSEHDVLTFDNADDAAPILEKCRATGIDALLVLPDRQAAALVQEARHGGIRVPEELAVIAHDDELAALSDPALTAIRPPKAELGAAAVELLIRRLRSDGSRATHHLYLSPQLVIRQSCGATAETGSFADPAARIHAKRAHTGT